MKNADDVVERFSVNRVACIGRLDHRCQGFLGRQVNRERDDLRARDHHVGDFLVGEVEDLVEHLLLFPLDLAVLGGTPQEHAELGL